jgi:hypothetical protein
MTASAQPLRSATRTIDPALSDLLRCLKPGDLIQITQTVRVGYESWQTTVKGKFRQLNYLVTGLATDRVREDEIVVIAVHFTKDSGELSSITLDEHTKIERFS